MSPGRRNVGLAMTRFTADEDPDADRAWRTHWSPSCGSATAGSPPTRPKRMTVQASPYEGKCEICSTTSGLLLKGKAGGVCLDCADLGHLEFLPSGDAALTRRAVKASRQSAVVMHRNIRRQRFERKGVLAEPAAIEKAAQECLSDEHLRGRRRENEPTRRAAEDMQFRENFAAAIRDQFPGCPTDRAEAIALHTAARGSGRVGRTVAGRALDSDAIRLAVIASVRHVDTDYDAILMSGVDRESARVHVRQRVEDILNAWRDGVAMLDE